MIKDYDEMEELTKEVYSHFGLTYYFSECLHRQLCNMYILSGFRDRNQITQLRIKEKMKYAYSLTLGQVADLVLEFIPLELQPKLSDLVEKRNFLAHHFW